VALVRTDVSEKRISSFINVKIIRKQQQTTLFVAANVVPIALVFVTLMMEARSTAHMYCA
jgi:hypothetical protein